VVNGGGTVAGSVVVVVETVVVTTRTGGSLALVLLPMEASELSETREMRLVGRFSAVMEVVRKVAIGSERAIK
jgi:hypothetical protein